MGVNNFKRIINVVLILIVLVLDFTALDDITTGNEPDYFGEYVTLIISIPLLIFLIPKLFRKRVIIKK